MKFLIGDKTINVNVDRNTLGGEIYEQLELLCKQLNIHIEDNIVLITQHEVKLQKNQPIRKYFGLDNEAVITLYTLYPDNENSDSEVEIDEIELSDEELESAKEFDISEISDDDME